MKDFYRVIFEWKGQPLTGFNVSDKMYLETAKMYYEQIEQQGYEPELLKIERQSSFVYAKLDVVPKILRANSHAKKKDFWNCD